MEFYIDIFLNSFAVAYSIFVLLLAVALVFYRSPQSPDKKFMTILIPARNEAAHIGACLEALAGQDYDKNFFEIIVINDRSSDDTGAIAESFAERFKHFQVLHITETPAGMAPKKNALNEGIRAAKGEIILCSDADCYAQPAWIRSMADCFAPDVGMVIGYSPIEPKNRGSVFHHFVALDSLALASAASASCLWNKPVTATGRSLAYRKKTFDEVGGFSKIAHFISGDDDLLLGLIKKTKWKIAYNMNPGALVTTYPPSSFRQFVNQKIRQASKGRHYSWNMVAALVIYYVFNLLLITYIPYQCFLSNCSWTTTLPWLLKFSADFILLLMGALRFRKLFYLSLYPLLAFLHPVYIAIFGVWGQFGKFDWKETQHSKRLKV